MTRRDVIVSGLAGGALAIAVPALSREENNLVLPAATGNLRDRAKAKGLLVGSAVSTPQLTGDPRLRDVLKTDCNVLVPENELKWSRLQPDPDKPLDYSQADQIYAFATANGMAMRGHNLTWWNGNPPWAKEKLAGLSAGQLGDYLQKHVAAIVGRWRGRLIQWDVANEPVSNKGPLPDTLWAEKLGDQYLDLAFEAARAADPDVKLVFNQNLIEQEQPYQISMRTATLRLLEKLRSRNVPIDIFGAESHITTQYTFWPEAFRRFLDEVTGMGLGLMVTELDVNDNGTLGSIERRDMATATLARNYLDVVLSYPGCRGLLTWGEVDSQSWLQKMGKRQRADGLQLRPSPRDANYQRKPIWRAIAAAIDGTPKR